MSEAQSEQARLQKALEIIESICDGSSEEFGDLDDAASREAIWQLAAEALGHPDPFADEDEDEDEELTVAGQPV